MNSNNETYTGEVTLAYSISAIEQLEDPKAVFKDAQNWSQSIGIIDNETERINRITGEFDLQQDLDMQDRDKWFVLEEVCETASTPRHVYIGANDDDIRVSTLFFVGSMSHLSLDEEKLFTEATDNIKTEIEVSVTESTTVLPSHADLVEHGVKTVMEALESVDSEIDIDAVEGAIADVKKALVLGQRADAFDSEYVSETKNED